jgi:hypothetical protein
LIGTLDREQSSRKLEGKNMAEKMRYNKIIDLLEHDKPVFSTGTVPNGSLGVGHW